MSTITTRAGKGAPLTYTEMDANFTALNADKLEASALAPYETSAHASATYETKASATQYLKAANNLSDVANLATAQTNLNVPTRTGGNASGTWGIDITGNAATANGLSTTLGVAKGGTGLTSPGASGNVLTSNGVAWVSQAPTGTSVSYSSTTTPLPTAGAVISLSHGLGSTPVDVGIELTCITAEFGYSVGDIIQLTSQFNGSTWVPVGIWKTATLCGLTIPSGYSFASTNKTTGAGVTLTAANWSYRFKFRMN